MKVQFPLRTTNSKERNTGKPNIIFDVTYID